MKKSHILELLKTQRKYFIYLANGSRHITNPRLYYSLEDELLREQRKIGLENKKIIKLELKGKPFPNEVKSRVRNI